MAILHRLTAKDSGITTHPTSKLDYVKYVRTVGDEAHMVSELRKPSGIA